MVWLFLIQLAAMAIKQTDKVASCTHSTDMNPKLVSQISKIRPRFCAVFQVKFSRAEKRTLNRILFTMDNDHHPRTTRSPNRGVCSIALSGILNRKDEENPYRPTRLHTEGEE